MCGAAVLCRRRDTTTIIIIIVRRTIGRLLTDTKNLPTGHTRLRNRADR